MDKPTITQVTGESAAVATPKKPYTPLQVFVHGTVAELTLGNLGTFPDQGPGSSLGQ